MDDKYVARSRCKYLKLCCLQVLCPLNTFVFLYINSELMGSPIDII